MARTSFDPKEFRQMLETSGVPSDKAEALTWDITCLFVHRLDALDIMECMAEHLKNVETNLSNELESRVGRVDQHVVATEKRISRILALSGIILVVVALPALYDLLGWMGY